MAVGHLKFDDQTQHGRILRRFLNAVEETLDLGADLLAAFAQMIDGDGSQAAHFTYLTARLGTPSDAVTKSLWEELQSAYSKVSGDGSVSSVNAALKQVVAKLR